MATLSRTAANGARQVFDRAGYVAREAARGRPDAGRYLATCGHCGRTWDDGLSSGVTPAPAARVKAAADALARLSADWAPDPLRAAAIRAGQLGHPFALPDIVAHLQRAAEAGRGTGGQWLQRTEARAALAAATARLNGMSWDLRRGSLFEPVAGERFDLIVSNPPFVVGAGVGRPARRKLPVRSRPSTSVGAPSRNTGRPPTNTALTVSSLRLTIRVIPPYSATVSSA